MLNAGPLTHVVGKAGAEPWALAVVSHPSVAQANANLCADFIDLSSWVRTPGLSHVTRSSAPVYVANTVPSSIAARATSTACDSIQEWVGRCTRTGTLAAPLFNRLRSFAGSLPAFLLLLLDPEQLTWLGGEAGVYLGVLILPFVMGVEALSDNKVLVHQPYTITVTFDADGNIVRYDKPLARPSPPETLEHGKIPDS